MNLKREILISEEMIKARVKSLATEIDSYYKSQSSEEIVVVPLLRGSFIFAADLVREIHTKMAIDFITTSSYDNEKISSGFVKIVNDCREQLTGKDVMIVDDILDSGKTMKYIVEHLKKQSPRSIKVCVLLDKPSRRKEEIEPDFVGFEIEDVFIVGYGLNYEDHYRNVPYVFTFVEETD